LEDHKLHYLHLCPFVVVSHLLKIAQQITLVLFMVYVIDKQDHVRVTRVGPVLTVHKPYVAVVVQATEFVMDQCRHQCVTVTLDGQALPAMLLSVYQLVTLMAIALV